MYVNSANVGSNAELLKFSKQKHRSLLDSGAEVSLILRRVFDNLKIKPKLFQPSLNLATAGNTPLYVDGFAMIEFEVGSRWS